MLKYRDNMDVDLGDTREVVGVVYDQKMEALIYRAFGLEARGYVVVEEDEDEV